MSEQDILKFHDQLYLVDHFVAQPIGDDFGGNRLYGTAAILKGLRSEAQVLMIPNLFFTGYAPDSYCVTFRKKWLQAPMPVHDVNFIYSYLKHDGERDLVSADYVEKIDRTGLLQREVHSRSRGTKHRRTGGAEKPRPARSSMARI